MPVKVLRVGGSPTGYSKGDVNAEAGTWGDYQRGPATTAGGSFISQPTAGLPSPLRGHSVDYSTPIASPNLCSFTTHDNPPVANLPVVGVSALAPVLNSRTDRSIAGAESCTVRPVIISLLIDSHASSYVCNIVARQAVMQKATPAWNNHAIGADSHWLRRQPESLNAGLERSLSPWNNYMVDHVEITRMILSLSVVGNIVFSSPMSQYTFCLSSQTVASALVIASIDSKCSGSV